MTAPDVVLVLASFGARAEAESAAAALVEQRLAACASVTGGVRSVYRWQGRLEHADEVLLIAKTVASRAGAAVAAIRAASSYELPEVLVVPVTGGLPEYLDWVAEATV